MITKPTYTGNIAVVGCETPVSSLDGYMSGDEFEHKVKSELRQLYLQNGLLQ